MQDASLQESMGPIMDRTREHLLSTDNGIIMARQRLLRAARALEKGEPPPGTDPATHRVRSAAVVLPQGCGVRGCGARGSDGAAWCGAGVGLTSGGGADMAWKRMVLQIGMGTDIRGADYTKAAVRALRDALWHNSLSVADAVGLPVDSMRVEVTIGVPKPERVDKAAVLAVLPHGTGTVTVVEGGLEIPNDAGTNSTVIANAAAVVRLDV